MVKKYGMWIGIGALVVFMGIATTFFGAASTDTSSDEGIDPDLIAAGGPLYQANCAECHGSDLRGTDLGPSHLSIVYQPNHHGDIAFVLAARNGVNQHHWRFGDMLPVPGLNDDDLDAIIAFVRENQRIFGFEPYPP